MVRHFVRSVIALAVIAAPASAQRLSTPPVSVSPYAGYISFGKLAEGPLNTRVTSGSAPIFGAQLNIPLGQVVSIVGNVGYTEPDLKAGVPIIGDYTVGESKVWLYDAGLQLSAPTSAYSRGISPFVQLGAGAIRYDVSVGGLERRATNTAAVAGLGADIPLARNLGLRLVARDYIGKFDFEEATTFDVDSDTSHNIALSAGLKLMF